MIKFTLRQLSVFLAIAETGQMTKAAAKIHLTQSAASMALKDLESILNVKLFLRERRKAMRLTPEGERLQPLALKLLQDSQQIAQLQEVQTTLQGKLRIGASTTIGNFVLPPFIADFAAAHFGVSVQLDLANTREIIEGLKSWNYDFALVEGRVYDSLLEVKPWRDDELFIFAGLKNPLSQKPIIRLADLDNQAWILREPGSGTRELVEAFLQGLNVVNTPVVSNSIEAIKTLVRESSNYVSCMSKYILADDLAAGKLKVLKPEGLSLQRKFYLVVLKERPQSGVALALLKALQIQPPAI